MVVARGMEWVRLWPQGAELWNRISTALAVLEVTNGNVDATADMIAQVHIDYSLENRPRYFRQIGKTRLPQAITMFKMYMVAMMQLTGTLFYDTVSNNGQSAESRARAAAALAGVMLSHTVGAGILGGVMIEPLRALRYLWNALFGDDDEYQDLDNATNRWLATIIDDPNIREAIAYGLPTMAGYNLSGRLGLDRMLFYNPPDFSTRTKAAASVAEILVGPMGKWAIDHVVEATDYWQEGKPLQAINALIPVRMWQSAVSAIQLASKGVTTKAGREVVPASEFSAADIGMKMAGFRTNEETRVSENARVTYEFRNWKSVRVRHLVNAYLNAEDAAAKAEAVAAIRRFNLKNPRAPITSRTIRSTLQGQVRTARDRQGAPRSPAERELLDY
jgi:predicted membrane protein